METTATKQLTPEEIQSVYSGKHGCACGCRGKHTYRSAFRDFGVQARGYSFGPDDVNDRVVARHLKTINAAIARGEALDGGNHVYFETESRLFVAYLVAPAVALAAKVVRS